MGRISFPAGGGAGGGGGVTDHGDLDGLGDNDHPYVLESVLDANTVLYATTDNTPAALAVAASRLVGRKSTGDIVALTGAEAAAITETLIAEVVVAGAASATIDFTDIPSTFRDLRVVGRLRSNRAAAQTDVLQMRLGGASAIDTGNNYRYAFTYAGSTSGSGRGAAVSAINVDDGRIAPANDADAGTWGFLDLIVFDYADTSFPRVVSGRASAHILSTISFNVGAHGEWVNTADAVQRVRLLLANSSFIVGSKVRLYGIR